MPDQMPLSVFQIDERGALLRELLHTVFSEHTQSRRIRLVNAFRFNRLAYRHQRDRIRTAVRTRGGPRDALMDSGNVFGNRHTRDCTVSGNSAATMKQ